MPSGLKNKNLKSNQIEYRLDVVQNNEEITRNPVKRDLKFKENVRNALKKIGLENVNGGQSLSISRFQIDAIGGINNCLLIIGCVWSQKRKIDQKIREKISELNGVKNAIKKDITDLRNYSRYTDFRFIVTTNAEFSKEIDEYAKQNDIILWRYDDVLAYYENLARFINKYAKYSLAGELNIKPDDMEPLMVPCFSTSLGPYIARLFFINAKELLKRSYVARRERRTKTYYQRSLDEKRIRNIKKYIEEEGGFFPNNIIIAFDGESRPKFISAAFKPNNHIEDWYFPVERMKSGLLQFPITYRACAIIDGQHRLFSFSETKTDQQIPVLAIDGIDESDQARLFIDINGKQKKVDQNLLWELQNEFRPDIIDGRISGIVIKLSEMKPFVGIISTYSKKLKNGVNLAEICSVIKKTKLTEKITDSGYGKNPLYDHIRNDNIHKSANIIANYFISLKDIFDEQFYNNFILRKNGIILFITILEKIIATDKKPIDDELFNEYLAPLSAYIKQKYNLPDKIKELDETCNSISGRSSVYKEFATIIKKKNRDFDPKLHLANGESELKNIERRLCKFIYEKYMKTGEINIDKGTEGKIKSRLKSGEEFHIRMALGNCLNMIETNSKIFDEIFVGPDLRNPLQGRFPNRESYLGAIKYLKETKADESHQEDTEIKNKELLQSYIDTIKFILIQYGY